MSRENYPMAFKGKRVIVFWNEKARDEGCDWPSFEVLDECDDGMFCRGVATPAGELHDGTKCFVEFSKTLDVIEWKKEEA